MNDHSDTATTLTNKDAGSNNKETSINDITLEVCVNEDEDVGNVLV